MKNNQIEDALFLLLRMGLAEKNIVPQAISILADINSQQWEEIISLSEKHGVFAIMLDGMQVLRRESEIETAISKFSWLKLCGLTTLLEQRNSQQLQIMKELCGRINADLCSVLVVKGQANAIYYPNPLHRACGDIDFYLFGHYEQGNILCQKLGADVDLSWYKHSQISYKGEMFENHKYFVTTRNGLHLRQLNSSLLNLLEIYGSETFERTNIRNPNPNFTALFLMYHSLGHFLSEGLHLKQVLDWVQFVRKEQNRIDWGLLNNLCERYHLKVFLDVMMDISVNKFGVEVHSNHVTTQCKFTDKVLNSILYDDDYVFSVDNTNWKQRFHLIRNVYKYRWKYEEIYDYSIKKHLFHTFCGFVFNLE